MSRAAPGPPAPAVGASSASRMAAIPSAFVVTWRRRTVLVAEGAPGAGDPEADDLRAGRLRELLPEELGDLLRPRDRVRGGQEHRQVLPQRPAVRDAAVDPERAGEAHPAHAPFRGGAGDVEEPIEQALGGLDAPGVPPGGGVAAGGPDA